MDESRDLPAAREKPPAMDSLFQLLVGLGCAFIIAVPLLCIAFCLYVYFWGLKNGF